MADFTFAMWQTISCLLCEFISPEVLVINIFEHLRIFLVVLGNSSEFLGLSKWDLKKNLVFPEVNKGCLPFTWRNRLVDGLCKWKAKFPYWKFPFGVACTIWTTDPTYRKSLGRLWHLQNGGWNRCIQRDYRCFNWRVITSRSFSIMRKMENST